MIEQKIIMVDKNDKIIGYKLRKNFKKNELNRVSALWIENSKGEVLIAQRAFSKSSNPGLWGPAVAGTVEKGETYEENMVKEANEEIGLTDFKYKLFKKFKPDKNRPFFATWFIAIVEHPISYFKKQDEEVEKIMWIKKQKLKKWLEEKPHDFVPSAIFWPEYFLK